jgi:ferric-dicitrate binding protein FerR (iron transport regulator)
MLESAPDPAYPPGMIMRHAALAALTAALLCSPASAKEKANGATLAHVEGKVTVVAGGVEGPGKAGARLADGDRVSTGKASLALIEMPDGSLLKLKELSSVVVEMPKPSVFGALLTLGGVFARVNKRAPGYEFRVRAGSAVAAVRGTEFFTAFGRETRKGRDLWVCVREGSVDVGTTASKKTRPVPAGKGVLIKAGLDLTDPQAYEWTEKLNWNMDPKSGKIADRTDLDKAYSDLLDQDYR